MKKSGLTVVVGVLLILAALFNLGAGVVQYGKASLMQGTTEAVASFGEGVASMSQGNPFAARLRSDSSSFRQEGTAASTKVYMFAFFLFATAVLQVAASVGLFGGKHWAFNIVVGAGICGFFVEILQIAGGGFNGGHLLFLGAYALVLYTAFMSREPVPLGQSIGSKNNSVIAADSKTSPLTEDGRAKEEIAVEPHGQSTIARETHVDSHNQGGAETIDIFYPKFESTNNGVEFLATHSSDDCALAEKGVNAASEDTPTQKSCPRCNASNDATANFCVECGSPIDDNNGARRSEIQKSGVEVVLQKSPADKKILLPVSIIGAIIALVIGSGYLANQNEKMKLQIDEANKARVEAEEKARQQLANYERLASETHQRLRQADENITNLQRERDQVNSKQIQYLTPQWGQHKLNGSLPVGVWSETISGQIGCRFTFPVGMGDVYRVRYRSHMSEWREQQPNTFIESDQFQLMLLKPLNKFEIKSACDNE